MADIEQQIDKIIRFFKTDLWQMSLRDFSRRRAFLLYRLRVLVLAFRGFIKDNCSLHASALTFYTLLSLVPVMAMILGIAKGFGIQSVLKEQLRETVPEHKEILSQVLEFANSLLDKMPGGIIAGVGVAILLWTVIKVMSSIEESFNQIWNIRTARSWLRKFTDYLAIVVLGPVIFIISSSLTVLITAQVAEIVQNLPLSDLYGPFVLFLLKAVPYSLVWLLFFLIYLFIPNTSVKILPALYAAIIAGTLYQLTQWFFIEFQIGVSRNSAIYGSFAAIPLFLIWLQVSWSIVLFGGELAFSIQNVKSYAQEVRVRDISDYDRKLLTLALCTELVKKFQKGEPPPDADELSDCCSIPVKLVRDLLHDMLESELIVRAINDADERVEGYQPARNVDDYTVHFVLQRLESRGKDSPTFLETDITKKLNKKLQEFEEQLKKSKTNIRLTEL